MGLSAREENRIQARAERHGLTSQDLRDLAGRSDWWNMSTSRLAEFDERLDSAIEAHEQAESATVEAIVGTTPAPAAVAHSYPRATKRQVDYIAWRLVRAGHALEPRLERLIPGGTVDRGRIASLTRGEASRIITILTEQY